MTSRAMKARKSSRVSCGHYVLRGQLIVKAPGAGWRCLPCALGPEHAAAVDVIDSILGVAEITTAGAS